jgi:hypothetical protein
MIEDLPNVGRVSIGIDPGKKGALAYILESRDGKITVNAVNMEQLPFILHRLSMLDLPIRCCLEKVHAMPKQGVTSTFSFGEGFGWLKGVMDALGISYQEVPPQKWKREFGLNSDKQTSIQVCKRLFPDADLRPSAKCRVDNDGMAEALLMAEYARRKL